MNSIANGQEHIEQTVLNINRLMDNEPDPLKRQAYRNLVKEAIHELESRQNTGTSYRMQKAEERFRNMRERGA